MELCFLLLMQVLQCFRTNKHFILIDENQIKLFTTCLSDKKHTYSFKKRFSRHYFRHRQTFGQYLLLMVSGVWFSEIISQCLVGLFQIFNGFFELRILVIYPS